MLNQGYRANIKMETKQQGLQLMIKMGFFDKRDSGVTVNAFKKL